MPHITVPGTVWIAADMHLRPDTSATNEAFLAFVAAAAEQADALILPGDIFDAWIGDDVLDQPPPWLAAVLGAVADASRRIPVWIGHGNRDFLMGERLARAMGARLLPGQAVIETDAGRFLLSHGDELCTDDVPYQQMRAVVRNPAWQADVLAKPLPERMQIAARLREQSEHGKAGKTMEIMDVNQQAVETALCQAGVTRLIHGHTHRPGHHRFLLGDTLMERWVLPDWDLESTPARGGWIALDRDGPALHDIELE
ncbi:UDP-2,3-diacylglucosamine diphosphatase [Verticiella sediminum]|uniref:UDP-2,3-diacylglucosamine hydrolase n=1 Tax=Verticiella sediminum TaxID=1247510 RepID=A0A556AUP5_9BURK|nr:UDP-2,3-diacylglucosamine diphosphatase [Verticiella sediminum]TSH96661.1 UDP-2,3-diacylglucosamine diphosphatase [Verticiella sediminum]